MKKIFYLFLSVVMIFSLCACDLSGIIDDGGNDDEEGESLETTYDEENEKLKKLAIEKGYQAIYVVYDSEGSGEDDEMTIGASGEYSWYISGDSGAAFRVSDDLIYIWNYSDGEWTYERRMTDTDGSLSSLTTIYNTYLLLGYSYGSNMKKDGTAKIAGRTCDKYQYGYSNLGMYSFGYIYYLDQETGICMKWEASSQVGTESASVGFEVKELKVGIEPIKLPEAMDLVDYIPENFKIVFDDVTAIKIGSKLYYNNGTELFFDFSSASTKVYTKYESQDWELAFESEYFTPDSVYNEYLGFVFNRAKEALKGIKEGTEVIAGVTCDKLVITFEEGTDYEYKMVFYQDPVTKLVFATGNGESISEQVSEFTSNISSFDVEIPE